MFLPIPTRPTLKNIQHTNIAPKETVTTVEQFADDPIGFAYWLGVKLLTHEQKEILLSIRNRPVTNVQAAHGVGKVTWLASVFYGGCLPAGVYALQQRPLKDRLRKYFGVKLEQDMTAII